jgi:hypothetical protein
MRAKLLVRIATIAIAARSHPFALISLKIQLNYFAIAARPSSVPVSDMHEIRKLALCNLFASAFGRLCALYYVEIYCRPNVRLLYKLIPDTVCILTTTLTLSIRPAVAAAFVKSVNTVLDKLCDKKRHCLALITSSTFFK